MTTGQMLKRAQELEREAEELKIAAQILETNKKHQARADFYRNNPEVYHSHDYCGIKGLTSQYSFYYGYEETNKEGEWCFRVKKGEEVVMTIPSSKLLPDDSYNVLAYLVAGMARFIDAEINKQA